MYRHTQRLANELRNALHNAGFNPEVTVEEGDSQTDDTIIVNANARFCLQVGDTYIVVAEMHYDANNELEAVSDHSQFPTTGGRPAVQKIVDLLKGL